MNRELKKLAKQATEQPELIEDAIQQAYDNGKIDGERRKRTPAQNSALHLYCSWLAIALNDAGLTQEKMIKGEIDWTTISVKEKIWKFFQKKLYNKKSTTQLDKTDLNLIHDHIVRFLAEDPRTAGLDYIPFPSEETMLELKNK